MAKAPQFMTQNDLSDSFLRCRNWRHAWEDFFPIDMLPPEFGWRESLRCSRCYTQRHRIIDRKGAVNSVRYIYPEGYERKGGGKLEVTDLRSTMFDRMREQLAAHNAVSAAIMNGRSNGNGKSNVVSMARGRRGA